MELFVQTTSECIQYVQMLVTSVWENVLDTPCTSTIFSTYHIQYVQMLVTSVWENVLDIHSLHYYHIQYVTYSQVGSGW